MSNHRSSSSIRWFRPSLEVLEDRVVPSGIEDVLNNPTFQQFTQPLVQLAVTSATTFAQTAITNAAQGEFWIQQLNFAESAFASNPNASTFFPLAFDTIKLVNTAVVVDNAVTQLGGFTQQIEGTGFLSPLQESALNLTISGLQTESDRLTSVALSAVDDLFAAIIAVQSGQKPANPTPVPPPSSQTQTNGTVSESIAEAPATASKANGVISQSVTVTNPSNTPVTVTESYSGSDGTFTSMSDTCTNGSVTVTAAAPPSDPGVVGTWTTSVSGLPTQTNTTTWKQ
jgi:hypothetical protein